MASRAAQKQAARERRIAAERAQAERAQRERRLRLLGGVVILAAAIIAVAIAISSGGSSAPRLTGAAATQAAATVDGQLAGIPQSGTTLGSPSAKVTVTEFGDLKCPICRDFALGAEPQIISHDVRTGKVKLVYRSLCTATCAGPQPSVFSAEQSAAYAAGLQGKAWHYILLFYNLQGDETTSYVNTSFLEGVAKLVPGLDYSKWLTDSGLQSLKAQVSADENYAAGKGYRATPTVIVTGPKGEQDFTQSLEDYGTYQSAITAVA